MFGFGKKIEEPQVTQDVPVAEAKAEEYKIEWGSDLGKMSFDEAQIKITELNEGLLESAKPWRFPSIQELEYEFRNETVGFEKTYYWGVQSNISISKSQNDVKFVGLTAWAFDFNTTESTQHIFQTKPSNIDVNVRLVRDAA